MAQHPNLISSVLKFKCPKCQEGNLFCNKRIYHFKGFYDMPKECPRCGQDFEPESGFYLGAMYVSYAITIALNMAIFVVLLILESYTLTTFFIIAGPALLIALPYIFKISRSIWIAMMIKYDSQAIKNYEAQH